MGGYFPAASVRAPQQTNPLDTFARLMQIKNMLQSGRVNELNLAKLQRLAQDEEALRQAWAVGVSSVPVEGPTPTGQPLPPSIETDPNAMLQRLQQLAPHLVPGVQQQQEATQEAMVKLQQALANMDKTQLENAKTRVDMMGSLAQSVLINPESYPAAKRQVEEMGLVQPGQLPEQLTPELMSQLQQAAAQAQTVKDMVTQAETARHNREIEKLKPIPGRDVPLPADVAKQRADITAAGRAEPGSYIPLTNDKGNVVAAWNPKSKQVEQVPAGLEGTRRSGLTGTELSRRAILSGLSEDMARVTDLAEKFHGTSVIGFGTGAVGSLKRRIAGGDPDAIDLERMLNNAADILLRARSGAQINEQEYSRLRRLIPSLNESEDSFFTKLAGFRAEIDKMVERTTSQPQGGGSSRPSLDDIFK